MPNKNMKKAPAGIPQGLATRANIAVNPVTYREDDDSVEFTLATEEPARVWDWQRFETVTEVILAAGVNLPKNKQIPLINSHDRSNIDNILGSVRDIRVEGESVIGRLYFSKDETAQRALNKIREGHLDSGSVGYEQVERVWVPEGENIVINGKTYAGPMLITKSWNLKEFSLVAIGADPNAKAREEIIETVSISREAVEQIDKESETMEKITNPVEQPQTVDVEAIKREALQIEQTRAAKITELCTRHGCPEMAADFIRTSASIESVQDKILDTIAARTVSLSTARPADISIGKEASEKFREAAADSIVMRAGMSIAKPAEGAQQMRGMSLLDVARAACESKGISTRFMGKLEILERALSTSDFPNILANVANKSVAIGFGAARQTWRLWAKAGNLPDFKASKRVRLSDAPEMTLNMPGEEIDQGIISDNGEEMTLKTYARKLVITRQALINDDAMLFNNLFRAFGNRAGNQLEAAAYGVLVGNAAMSDGGTLFNTTAVTTTGGHANQASSGALISSSTVNTGMIAMGKQVGEQGTILSLQPRYLICGFENKIPAEILTNSTQQTDATYNVDFNPFRGQLVAVVSGHITTKKWFMAADPNEIDTVELAFLDGRDAPTLYQAENQGDILGRSFVGYIDYVAKALEWRSMYYNPGQ